MDILKELVPLFQTLLWIAVIIGMLQVFRPEITLLREELSRRVRRGGALEIGPLKIGELREELHSVKKQLDETNERISKLFLITMSPDMYRNLRKLSRPQGFGDYDLSGGLERELFHLRDIGYIEVPYIKSIPKSGTNLSDFVTITLPGRQFVELREAIITEKE
ncbi:MAG: hypothetical protein WBM78_27040 [Desulfobacterales bacterium]